MTQPSFRQIKVMVDNQLLSHLSMEALQGAATRANSASNGDAESQFTGEDYYTDELQLDCKALDEALELRARSAGGSFQRITVTPSLKLIIMNNTMIHTLPNTIQSTPT